MSLKRISNDTFLSSIYPTYIETAEGWTQTLVRVILIDSLVVYPPWYSAPYLPKYGKHDKWILSLPSLWKPPAVNIGQLVTLEGFPLNRGATNSHLLCIFLKLITPQCITPHCGGMLPLLFDITPQCITPHCGGMLPLLFDITPQMLLCNQSSVAHYCQCQMFTETYSIDPH